MSVEELSATISTPCSTFSLPFYTSDKSLRFVTSCWDKEHSVSLVQHQQERTFLQQVYNQKPPVVVFGANKAILLKQTIERVAGTKHRPIIIALVKSINESEMSACYRQGADRVVAVPHCSSRIFCALITALHSRDIYYPPYRFEAATQSCSIGDRIVRLTTKRFDIAQYLFVNQGKLVSKPIILKDVWGLESTQCVTRRLEVHMSYLRRELSLDGSQGWEIRSRRNKGYGVFQTTEDPG